MPGRKITLSRFVRRLAEIDRDMEQAIIRALRASALKLDARVLQEIDRAQPYPAVDRGELRNSRTITETARGAIVSVDAPHAGIIENGTRPFFPPLEPLKRWVLRKGITDDEAEAKEIALSIARKFASKGIAPRHYFKKAWERFVRYGVVTREVKRELRRIGRMA